MNKIILYLCLITVLGVSLPVSASEPVINAQAAVLIDLNNGQVLWERNSKKIVPPASTTKILTAILAYDVGNINKICTISNKAASVGEATINLRQGEKITLGDLLKGALMCSGNDATVAVAESVSGSEELFVKWMNLKAKILGAYNSWFVNTNGLPAKEHLVTAYDLALIARYAMYNKQFSSVVCQRYDTIGQGSSKRYLKNTNKLLWNYRGCIGIKTGTTVEAGPCLVSAVEKGNEKYLCVVLNSPDRYGDSQKLLEYAVQNFSQKTIFHQGNMVKSIKVLNGTELYVSAVVAEDEMIVLPEKRDLLSISVFLPEQVFAPVIKGQSLGHMEILDSEKRLISQVNIVAGENVPEKLSWWEKQKNLVFKKIKEFFRYL